MTSNVPCKDCVSGFEHSGTPVGTEEKIHGLDTYVTGPADGLPPKGLIVIIPDAFGWNFVNNRIVADAYAKKGQFLVYLPHFMVREPMAPAVLHHIARVMGPANGITDYLMKPILALRIIANFLPFVLGNRPSKTLPIVTRFFTALRAEQSLPTGVAGFCWGGKHAIMLTHPSPTAPSKRPLVDAAFTAHPSGLAIPADIHPVAVPLSVAVGDKDMALDMKGVNQIKAALEPKGAKGEVEQEVRVYAGARHGFACRGNPYEPEEGRMADEAEAQAIAWFTRFLVVAKPTLPNAAPTLPPVTT